MSSLAFYRELRNIYKKCHKHRCLHRRINFVGILPRFEKYLLDMPQSPTPSQTDKVRWYFTESWKIFTIYVTITDRIYSSVYFQLELLFFCAHFLFAKPSVIVFLPTDLAMKCGITDKRHADRHFTSVI